MRIPQADADLFFELMWGLQFYVKQREKLSPEITTRAAYSKTGTKEKVPARSALWKKPKYIEDYVQQNPDALSPESLDIIRLWKHHVQGKFYIFRHLKKYSIFIGENNQVYGVLGLYDELEDILWGHPLPVYVETVLLPFKGQIVYDGLMSSYNIYFGGGIKSSLNETYMAAKQNQRILTMLGVESVTLAPPPPPAPLEDWLTALQNMAQEAKKLKGGTTVQTAAFSLLRASLALTDAAVNAPQDQDALFKEESKVRRALTRLQNVLERME